VYTLNHYAYCGMRVPLGEGDYREMRAKAASIIRRRRRQGFPVVQLDRHEWEIQEPEDCFMVPDQCGVMTLRKAA
jgi:hypothetical protein